MQFGLGPHFFRTIGKQMTELAENEHNVNFPIGVDLESAREAVEARLTKSGKNRPDEVVYITPDSPYSLDARIEAQLNRLIQKHNITAVAISVPPEAHLAYALWALKKGLHVFLEKPVTSRPDAVNSLSAARGIFEDFVMLEDAYTAARQKHQICATLNVHRPFQQVYSSIFKWVTEVRQQTGQVVSNITASHADGQMRVGSELCDVLYHGYRNGNGKLSHSGYHLIDVIVRLLKAGTCIAARPDFLIVRSSFRQPDALITAMPQNAWRKLLGDRCDSLESYSDSEMIELGRRMGEVDAHVSIEAIRNDAVLTTASLHLQHDTTSARRSLETPANWYRDTGRLKREHWHIDQGPMQDFRLQTIQTKDWRDLPGTTDSEHGDPNNLELLRRVNTAFVTGVERHTIYNAAMMTDEGDKHLSSERAKMASLTEFVACAQGLLRREKLTSELSSHRLGVGIMAAAYESHVRRGSDHMGNGAVRVDWAE
jgi:Oxidoreductase family, NAD-binding Rossmann fold